MRECGHCGKNIAFKNAQARFCSSKCRIYSHRAKSKLPAELTIRDRWVRHTQSKVPLTIEGTAASSTDPSTWSTYREAANSTVGVGIGFVLGAGIGCLDLDHCLTEGQPNEPAATFLQGYRGHYIEVSPSGDGLHIWGTAPEQPGTKRNIDGLSIETYSVGRYITVTGNVYQHGTLLPL